MPKLILHTVTGEVALDVQKGITLMEALKAAGYAVDAPCGGRCFCGKCQVWASGALSPMREAEKKLLTAGQIADGIRLACAATVLGDAEVTLQGAGSAQIETGGEKLAILPDAAVKAVDFSAPSPTLEDPCSDIERLEKALGRPVELSLEGRRRITGQLGACGYAGQAWMMGNALLGVMPGDAAMLGLAVDIGTTTVAAFLMDLRDARVLATAACVNPQRAWGADVISRIDAARQAQGAGELRQAIWGAIGQLRDQACTQAGVAADKIAHIVLAGNTAMMHLAAGLPAEGIAVSPFAPVYSRGFEVPAQQVGAQGFHPGAMVSFLPVVAGYVGADALCAALSCGMDQTNEITLMLDIGTNGEMVLGNRDGLWACSTAAGPAFEGAHIRFGMAAVSGAISRFSLEGDKRVWQTISDAPPVGICGSGLVDAVAALVQSGAIDMTGRLDDVPDAFLREVDGKPAFALADGPQGEVCLCARDIREVQLAKGAIAAGIDVLLRQSGLGVGDITRVCLAGGFGNWMNPASACTIGLMPPELLGRVKPVGNAAGTGARMVLANQACRKRLEEMRGSVRYIELSIRPDFQELFAEHMLFEEE
nr:ASKHA domain-containing protein [bacterium]